MGPNSGFHFMYIRNIIRSFAKNQTSSALGQPHPPPPPPHNKAFHKPLLIAFGGNVEQQGQKEKYILNIVKMRFLYIQDFWSH